ncbi:MAG: S41 family peptidase [Flavobacteriaceae bacterium]
MKKFFLFLFASTCILTSCSDSDDGVEPNPNPNPEPEADVTVQDFMWKAMNLWYFWQQDVPDLGDTRFASDEAYTDFLKTESDPSKFFENKLLHGQDRFSWSEEDYKALVQRFSGVSKSNGVEFGLSRFSGSDDIFGYVRYIVPNSDADGKDIRRGDLFTGVDGTTLNINNYQELLFGDNDTYTLNMATLSNNTISASGKGVQLTKTQLSENPVFLDRIYEIGAKKIGYLIYNSFTNEYDNDLNAAFGRFKAGGVTDLILDFRYNPGGSVNSSRLLSSMVYGTHTDKVYIRARYNDKYMDYLTRQGEDLNDYFADKVNGNELNTLNLNEVYVLTTSGTASASELVMNGLDPYVKIIQIGTTTRGKNEFSVTMVDDQENSFIYNPSRESKINPNNKWAIQPLIGRNENSAGFSDYTSGLNPDIELSEDIANLGTLGDQTEPLLARAIQEITQSGKRDFTVKVPVDEITNSKMFSPLKDNMYVDKLPALIK